MPLEYIITLSACIAAYALKPGRLTAYLVCAWVAFAAFGYTVEKSWLPATSSIVDIVIAVAALYGWTSHGSQRARCVGFLSMVNLVFHFGISANFGGGDWGWYAATTNAVFVAQCVVAGGIFNGLVIWLNRVSPRRNDDYTSFYHQRNE